ncbi:hypothetical protein LWM38_08180 [Vibrio kanaloae]|uniref:hypothetical protein n=1 Tax=Vibrio kanaloae TaxID=170673 RepID=UPI001F2B7687|nr:hypothetical protein [Vibrio kanaloae]UIJ39712.1 hypothetical protein LWM38_08180 [Vibrio kanaloae]
MIKLLKLLDKLNLNEFAVLSHKLKKCELYTGIYSGLIEKYCIHLYRREKREERREKREERRSKTAGTKKAP